MGGHLEQADGTAWMAFYCATMLSMALELAADDPSYEDIASKFFEHFVAITDAMNSLGGMGLWDEQDGFYYDVLNANGTTLPLRIRSMVGIIPLFAVEVLEQDVIDRLPGFKKRLEWFLKHRHDLARHISLLRCPTRAMTATSTRSALAPVAGRPLARAAGPRAALRARRKRVPLAVWRSRSVAVPPGASVRHVTSAARSIASNTCRANRTPACSAATRTGAGRSGSRSIICSSKPWSAITTSTATRCRSNAPPAPGSMMNLKEVAAELASRLTRLFLPDESGRRPCHGDDRRYADRSALARAGAVPRILPRRHRPRRRREPSDRLDRAGRRICCTTLRKAAARLRRI